MPMLNFQNQIRFDLGAITKLQDALNRLGIQSPLLVTDRGLRDNGVLDRITGVLEDSSSAKTYDGTPGNPTEEAVAEALEYY